MSHATVMDSLTVHGDLHDSELEALLHHWRPLDSRLRSFDAGTVHLHLHVKDRDRPGQHVTLEATIERLSPLVASSSEPKLERALNVVRDEMVRLITDARDRHHPRHRDRSIRTTRGET